MRTKKKGLMLFISLFSLALLPVLWLKGYVASPKIFFFDEVVAVTPTKQGDRYVVFSKVSYPKDHPFDPSGVVRIDREDGKTGTVKYTLLFPLNEIDNVKSLQIKLNSKGVPYLQVGAEWGQEVDGLLLGAPGNKTGSGQEIINPNP